MDPSQQVVAGVWRIVRHRILRKWGRPSKAIKGVYKGAHSNNKGFTHTGKYLRKLL